MNIYSHICKCILSFVFELYSCGGCHSRDRMVVELLPVQSVPITIKVVSTNPVHGELYSIQHYVIQFVKDFRQVSGFLQFPPPIKLTAHTCASKHSDAQVALFMKPSDY